jgi:DNA-binding transcriptional MerR regulator
MAADTTPRPELLGIGAVASALGVSPSILRRWERAAEIPAALRVAPDGRRVFRGSDFELIARRASRMRRRRATEEAPAVP